MCLHGNGSSKQKLNFLDKHNVELILRTPSNQRNKKISLKVITQPTDELLGLEGEEIKAYKDSLDNFKKTHNKEQKSKQLPLLEEDLQDTTGVKKRIIKLISNFRNKKFIII